MTSDEIIAIDDLMYKIILNGFSKKQEGIFLKESLNCIQVGREVKRNDGVDFIIKYEKF